MKKTIVFLAILFLSLSGNSQNGATYFHAPNSAFNGMANFISIDLANNVWLAGSSTASKFDGNNWQVFNSSNSLINGTINCMASTVGKTWFGTNSGLISFDGTNWSDFNTNNSPLLSNQINCLMSWGNYLFIGTNTGIYKLSISGWTHYSVSLSGILSDQIHSLYVSPAGTVFAGMNNGFSRLSGSTWSNFSSGSSPLLGGVIRSINMDNYGNILFNKGTIIFNGNSFDTFTHWYGNSVFFPVIQGNNSTDKSSMTRTTQGELFISSQSTLFMIKDGGVKIIYPDTLGDLIVSDNQGMIWTIVNHTLVKFDWSVYKSFYAKPTYSLSNHKSAVDNENFKSLDINYCKAGMLNRGDMHWDTYHQQYEEPKSSGKNTIFASAFWIGGIDAGGTLHTSAATYRQSGFDFSPGPLDTITGNTDSSHAQAYNKIWKVDKHDLALFQQNFANGNIGNGQFLPTDDIITWPASGGGNYSHDLAPFVDVNGDGLYNPLSDGDYPLIKGDQMLFWIFNDNLGAHSETNGLPMGIEVHASAYSYFCPYLVPSDEVLNYSTLYQYKIYNRSHNNYHDIYSGLWSDVDLGNANDDFIGCDPVNDFAIGMNGDNYDESTPGQIGYLTNPPRINIAILKGPVSNPGDGLDNNHNGTIDEFSETCMMDHFMYYYNSNDSAHGMPQTDVEYYRYMKGEWKDGTPLTYGGSGYQPVGSPSNFIYPGVPFGNDWNESSTGIVPGDRRMLLSSGPFSLPKGESRSIDFAYVFSWDSTLASTDSNTYIYKNRNDVLKIKNWFENNNFPSCYSTIMSEKESNQEELSLQVFPNPAKEKVFIVTNATRNSTAQLFDISGRELLLGKIHRGKNELNISFLAPSVYVLKITSGQKISYSKIVKY